MKWNVIYTLIVVWMLALIPLIPFYEDNKLSRPTDDTVRFMTFNLHFGLNFDGIYDIVGFKNVIEDQKPNIVGFQEVTFQSPFNGYTTMLPDLVSLMKSLGFDYYYVSEGYNYNLANVIFSQFKIISARTIDYDDWNAWQRNVIEVKIDVNGREVFAYSTHLTHIPGAESTGEIRIKEITQLMQLFTNINLNTQNVVIMGDFNIVPFDREGLPLPEYKLLTTMLQDAWTEFDASREGFTVPADKPERRIDYILVSNATSVINCDVFDTLSSDHLPVTCEIRLS